MVSSLNAIKTTTIPGGRTKLAYLLERIDELETPDQLRAFAESVVTLDLNADQKIPLFEAIVSRIGAITGSDREMYGASNDGNDYLLTTAIAGLVSSEKADDLSPVPLLLAYRAFLVRNLHTAACADSTSDRIAVAARFNALNSDLIGEDPKPISALSPQELTPTSFAGVAQVETITDDGGPTEQQRRIAQIFMANQKALYVSDSMQEYLQPRPSDVEDVLRRISELSKNDTSSTIVRFEKTMTEVQLLALYLPPGPSLKYAIEMEIELLNLNPVERQYPLSWLRYFHELLFASRQTTVEEMTELRHRGKNGEFMTELPSPDATFIQESLRRYQSDPIFAAYLAYEGIFQPVYETEPAFIPKPPL